MSFALKISQREVIDAINHYLEFANLPFHWNKIGVCHGLSTVYAKYCLENKEALFFDSLEAIVALNKRKYQHLGQADTELIAKDLKVPPSQFDRFITEVMLAFNPKDYVRSHNQKDSYKMLSINAKPLTSHFSLPLIANEEEWIQAITMLDMEHGEIFLVASRNHCVSVKREPSGDGYIIYDPNYAEGKKSFKSAEELVRELETKVFKIKETYFDMHITQINTADEKDKQRNILAIIQAIVRTKTELLRKSLVLDESFSVTNQIEHAILNLDCVDIIEYLYHLQENWSAKEIVKLMDVAGCNDNDQVFLTLLGKIEACSITEAEALTINSNLLQYCALHGASKCFEHLMSHTFSSSWAKRILSWSIPTIPLLLINKVAKGGHVEILQRTLEEMFDATVSPMTVWPDSLELNECTAKLVDLDLLENHVAGLETIPAEVDVIISQRKKQDPAYQARMITTQHASSGKNTLELVIEGNHPDCLTLLLQRLKEDDYHFPSAEYEKLLGLVIRQNKPQMLESLLQYGTKNDPKMVQDAMTKLNITLSRAKRTNLAILKTLKNNGATLAFGVNLVIKQKSHQTNIIDYAGIQLISFFDYLVDKVYPKPDIEFRQFKQRDEGLQKSLHGSKTSFSR